MFGCSAASSRRRRHSLRLDPDRFSPWTCWILALALAGACGAPASERAGEIERVEVDLVSLFPRAEVEVEASEFVVGSETAEPLLVEGWSFPERGAKGERSYRWGLRPATEFAFTVIAPRDLTIRLEGLPAPDARGPRWLRAELNGRFLGTLEVRKGWSQYVLPLPASAQIRGNNRLRLLYGDVPGASAPPLDRKRPNLAMAWSRIAIDGLEHPRQPPAPGAGETLFLPLGSRVEYLVRPGADPELVFDRVRGVGDRKGILEIYRLSDGSSERHLGSTEGGEAVRIDLGQGGEPLRLALVAVPTAASDSPSGTPARQGSSTRQGFLLGAPALVSTTRAAGPPVETASKAERPNIIVYLVDTLRSDRLGCYGHSEDVSPRLDRFASGAGLFENARAQSSWTLSSVASIFTGVWPPAHGVVHPNTSLSSEAVTLAEILSDAGYLTSAIVTNEFVTAKFGMEQGFEEHKTMDRKSLSSAAVLTETLGWLENRDRNRPFFLYIHTVDPHQPYLPEEEYRRRFAPDADEMFEAIRAEPARNKWEPTESNRRQLLTLYDALIAQNDAAFGRTLDALERDGIFDSSLIVFLSDHGEEFYEHRSWTHGANLFNETVNVPLVIKLPGQVDGRRIGRVAQHIDLLPTLLDVLDLDRQGFPGRSLLSDLTGPLAEDADLAVPPVFGHTFRNKKENFSVIDGRWKLMVRDVPGDSWDMLVDWMGDPVEQVNVAESHPIRGDFMKALLRTEVEKGSWSTADEAVLDEETRATLRALGYLD